MLLHGGLRCRSQRMTKQHIHKFGSLPQQDIKHVFCPARKAHHVEHMHNSILQLDKQQQRWQCQLIDPGAQLSLAAMTPEQASVNGRQF
jgi:hypothetical protein